MYEVDKTNHNLFDNWWKIVRRTITFAESHSGLQIIMVTFSFFDKVAPDRTHTDTHALKIGIEKISFTFYSWFVSFVTQFVCHEDDPFCWNRCAFFVGNWWCRIPRNVYTKTKKKNHWWTEKKNRTKLESVEKMTAKIASRWWHLKKDKKKQHTKLQEVKKKEYNQNR